MLWCVYVCVCVYFYMYVYCISIILHYNITTNITIVEKIICVVCVSVKRGHSGNGCDLVLTLCKYDLRKGDLFVLSWVMVRRVRQGSISSELVMCGGGMHSILLLPLVARCLETIDVCIWRMFVFMSVVVTVWVSMGSLL